MLSKKCEQCGGTFYKKDSTSMRNWQEVSKYCSRKCCNNAKLGKPSWNKGKPAPWAKNSPTVFKKGHVTVVYPESVRRGIENHLWKGGEVSKVCLICRESFSVERYRAESAKTCSLNCAQLLRKKPEQRARISKIHRDRISQGAHNCFWGYTNLVGVLRHCSLYRQWREGVFKRDNYTCCECYKRGDTLNADHIKPFASILFAHEIKSFEDAKNCAELWDLQNGRTLCRKCHKETPTFAKRLNITAFWQRKVNYMKKNLYFYLSKEFDDLEIEDVDRPITINKLLVFSVKFKISQTDTLSIDSAVTSINSNSLFSVARDMRTEIYRALGHELNDSKTSNFWNEDSLELARKKVVL